MFYLLRVVCEDSPVFMGGQFKWLKCCRGAPRQRGEFESRTAHYTILNYPFLIASGRSVKIARLFGW